MKILMVGEGAFTRKHLDAIACIEGVEVGSLCGGVPDDTSKLALERNIPHWTTNLDEALSQPGIAAAIIASPTPLHAAQAIRCMEAGKHVQVEIPMADNLAEAEAVVATQQKTGLVAMVGQTRRFNPSHQWIHQQIQAGTLTIQQMDVQTYFFRRTNMNALGQPRSWTDHLLWHHACHTVDLFQYQTGEDISQLYALQGPKHPKLGIAMDMSIGLKVPSGAICTLSLSFNNDGPLGTSFRYICDRATYIARYDSLVDGREKPIDVSNVDISLNGIELQDREFFSAIRKGREPNASVAQVISTMRILRRLEQCLEGST